MAPLNMALLTYISAEKNLSNAELKQVLALSLFMFFFFLGFMTMFFYSLKRQDAMFQRMSDEHARIRMILRALESRMDALLEEKNGDEPRVEAKMEGGGDPLLHLNFEEPPFPDKSPASGDTLEINFDPARPRGDND